jgi:lipid-A-disaccharide synthase
MGEPKKTYRVFISAAEPSADAHCAGLIKALQQSGRDIEFVGVGGPKMAEAGCELLEVTVARAAMIYNAFGQVAYYVKLIKRIRSFLQGEPVDLVIVCDSPAFNFHVAKAAKKARIRTLFYVAPQLWAWGRWRIGKLRKYCDKLCCILPFEPQWFGRRAIESVFVGNPLFDDLPCKPDDFKKQYSRFDPSKAVVAIMPGSRLAEMGSLWVPMQQIALRIKQRYSDARFVTVAVDQQWRELLEAAQIAGFESEYRIGSVSETASDADFSIVASGSATLQVAAVGCPMVIMYQSSRLLWYLIGWWLVTMRYLSLVNVLAGRELVPEYMPYFRSIDPIAERIVEFLDDRGRLAELSAELVELTRPLAAGNASEEVAKVAATMLEESVLV